jgi:striatin 1/3/4
LATQTERNSLLGRIHTLTKENQRHVELEKMLMNRIKLLENALWRLREKHGEEAGDERPSEMLTMPAREEQGLLRQKNRKAQLLKILQDNALEPVDLTSTEAAVVADRRKKPPKIKVEKKETPLPEELGLPQVDASALDSLQAMAQSVSLDLSPPAEPERVEEPPKPTEEKNEEEEEFHIDAEAANRMMRRMKGGRGKKGKGGMGQLVAAALGSASPPAQRPASSSASSSSSSSSAAASAGPHKWAVSHTMRSHLDVARALAFHPSRALLATASDDWTVRLFVAGEAKKKSANVDCVWTFRGHAGPVLSLCMSQLKEDCLYSGGIDGSIFSWKLPDGIEEGQEGVQGDLTAYLMDAQRRAHEDAVWGIKEGQGLLLSYSADKTVKLWGSSGGWELRHTIANDQICVGADFVRLNSIIVGYQTANALLWDVETQTTAATLVREEGGDCTCIQSVAGDDWMVISGHKDSKVCIWDTRTPEAPVASFVAHTGAVTCMDTSSSLIVTGAADTVRLWDLKTRSCLSDFVAHRQKFDEGVTALRFHPSAPKFASGGGDGVVKIFN